MIDIYGDEKSITGKKNKKDIYEDLDSLDSPFDPCEEVDPMEDNEIEVEVDETEEEEKELDFDFNVFPPLEALEDE